MTKQPKHPIDEAFEAVRTLPEAVQEMLAAEILGRVEELGESALTDAMRAEIRQRLSGPPVYADPSEVKSYFARHGVAE
jgi:hypothetical protein